jgi:alkylation response protein AidB-like acyl-CoA dehydrogenase
MSKLFGVEATRTVSDAALQIHGGVGCTKAFAIERIYRDVRQLWFEEGTNMIQRLIISRDVLGKKVRAIGK